MSKIKITIDEENALHTYARRHGADWRQKLICALTHRAIGGTLRQVAYKLNCHGIASWTTFSPIFAIEHTEIGPNDEPGKPFELPPAPGVEYGTRV